MRKKKLTAAVLGIAFALSITACSKGVEDPTQAGDTTAQVADTTAQVATEAVSTPNAPSETAKEEVTTVASTEGVSAEPTVEGTEASTEEATQQPTIDPREAVVALDSIDVFEYIDLSDVNSLEIKSSEVKVSEAYIKYTVAYYLQQDFGFALEEKDRPVEGGDTVIIDYVGSIDGVEFAGGKDEDAELGIGSETFIPGFEEGIIGKKTGDKFDLPVTFPEDYLSSDLAGKDAVFNVTVKAVKGIEEISDETIEEKSEGKYKTLKAYYDEIADKLNTYQHDSYIFNKIMLVVKENKKHEGLINEYVQQQYAQIDQVCAAYGISRSDFLSAYGYSEGELDAMLLSNGAEYALQKLVVLGICRQEGYEINDGELDDLKKRLIEEHELGDEATLMSYMTVDELNYQLFTEKFQDYISNYKTVD